MGSFENSQGHKETTTSEEMQESSNQVAVIMVPLLLHSHLNQLLQLSCLIVSSYPTIPVHYVSSSIHIKQVKARAFGFDPSHVEKVQFHELPMADFESPPPDPDSSNKFPAQLQPLMNASLSLREPFAEYLRDMSRKFRKVVVIHDFLTCAVVRDVVSVDNAESYQFDPISALCTVSFIFQQIGQTVPLQCSNELPSVEDSLPEIALEFAAIQSEASKHRSGNLINTVRSLESPFLDILASEEIAQGRKVWSIGPVLPTKPPSSGQESAHECLKWLDKHEPGSVICVSFGTTTSISDEQIRELALGLEQSGAKFLWILRDADRGNVFDGDVRRIELPIGFEERLKGVGLVVRDWAPQVDILGHPSTGGFVSHCGWNSVLESLTTGVPLATWPMHADQPSNAFLVTEILKAGVAVREWTQRRELTKASVIAEVVRKLMASEEGDVVRKRARELSATLRQAKEEGGESKVEMDSFIAHITRKQNHS